MVVITAIFFSLENGILLAYRYGGGFRDGFTAALA